MSALHTNKEPNLFLATTALEEFWDVSKPLVYLGEACKRHSRRAFWSGLEGKVMDDHWRSERNIFSAATYVDDLYERLLPALARALNDIHGLDHGIRYWRILLGPWLKLFYLPALYDRYLSLKLTLDLYPDITTIVLAEESCITPRDTLDFYQLILGDAYNLQMYSRILRFLGKTYPTRQYDIAASPLFQSNRSVSWKTTLYRLKKNGVIAVSKIFKDGHSIIFRDSHFSEKAHLQLICKTTGIVWPILIENPHIRRFVPDQTSRNRLADLLPAVNEFEVLLNKMIPLDLLQIYVEAFDALRRTSEKQYPAPPKAIFSVSAWFFDDMFKRWAAAAAEKGTLLLGMQHGGNYGSLLIHPSEKHELAITDRFYTWGWNQPGSPDKVVPRYASKLSGRTLLGANARKLAILYVSTVWPRFYMEYPYTPEKYLEYLQWQSRYIKTLSSSLQPLVRVRCHREDLGWDIEQRWKEAYPSVTRETWDTPFFQSLSNCRIYVCDNLGTTYIEALSANKPTILFWNPELNVLRPEAQRYFDDLRNARILHDSPESAATEVNAIYDDIETWWNNPDRQAARQRFCNRFAKTSLNAVDDWAKEFARISREGIQTHE